MCSCVTSVTGDPGSAQDRLAPVTLGKGRWKMFLTFKYPFLLVSLLFCHLQSALFVKIGTMMI